MGNTIDVKYHPPPSIGHEIGVMFGFIGTLPALGHPLAQLTSLQEP